MAAIGHLDGIVVGTVIMACITGLEYLRLARECGRKDSPACPVPRARRASE